MGDELTYPSRPDSTRLESFRLILLKVDWTYWKYNLRGRTKAVVPRFTTYFMKNFICYRGAVLWNCVSDYFKDSCIFKRCYLKAKSNPIFKEIQFSIK